MGLVRNPQRFTVKIEPNREDYVPGSVRHGSQANVIVYATDNAVVNAIGAFWMRLVAIPDLCQLAPPPSWQRLTAARPCARLQDRLCRRRGPHARRGARLGLPLLAGHACGSTLERARAHKRQAGGRLCGCHDGRRAPSRFLIAQVFVNSPFVLLLVVSLVTFLAFLLLARGQAVGAAAIFLITTAVVPLLATESMSVAYGFIQSLIAGSALAVLLTFAAHAFFPIRVQAQPVSALAQNERDSVALRARQYRGADEPCDLFHADAVAGEHRPGFDGH